MAVDWSSIGKNPSTHSAVGGAVGTLFGLGGQRLNYKYQKWLMSKQFDYQKQAFEMENARQDYLLENANLIAKNALEKAGYSTADPNGTGVTPAPTGNLDSPTQPGTQIDIAQHALQGAQIAASTRLMQSQAKKLDSETEGQDIQNYLNSTYGETQWQKAIGKLDSETQKNISEKLYLDQKKLNEKNLTDAEVDNIRQRLDMDWKKLPKSLQLLSAQAYEAEQAGNLNKAKIHEVWQNIRESAQRIDLMVKQGKLTDAQADVAIEMALNTKQDTRNKKIEAGILTTQSAQARLQYDIQNGLGVKWHQAKDIVGALLPIGATVGLVSKAFGK